MGRRHRSNRDILFAPCELAAGPALGGLDTQYKRNDFYPGVFQFGAEMAAYSLPPNMQVLIRSAQSRTWGCCRAQEAAADG